MSAIAPEPFFTVEVSNQELRVLLFAIQQEIMMCEDEATNTIAPHGVQHIPMLKVLITKLRAAQK